jgi:hypothetical protein
MLTTRSLTVAVHLEIAWCGRGSPGDCLVNRDREGAGVLFLATGSSPRLLLSKLFQD